MKTLKLIYNEDEIPILIRKFRENITSTLNKRFRSKVGHRNGPTQAIIWWSEHLPLWMAESIEGDPKDSSRKYWIPFGLDDNVYTISQLYSIVQINFPFRGYNRRYAGLFALNHHNNIVIAHSGKIGGGKYFLGQNFFWEHCKYEPHYIYDGRTNLREVAIVGELESSDLVNQVYKFVKEVKRIRDLL